MNKIRTRCALRLFAVVVVSIMLLVVAAPAQHFKVQNLTADVAGPAPNVHPNLVNPIGIARGINGPWWVANNGTPKSTLYAGDGGPRGLIVNLPSPAGFTTPTHATGTAFGGTSGLNVSPGNPALFLFVTLDGTILGWNPNVDVFNAIILSDRHTQASYTGMTIAEIGTNSFLYAVNAQSGRVEVFDTNYQLVALGDDAFQDPRLPDGLVPFNVQNIGQDIFVTYTRGQGHRHGDGDRHDDDDDNDATGWVAAFDSSGHFLTRLQNGPWLNAPWGIAQAPHDFGEFSHMLLVANHGNGTVAAFDPYSGKFAGYMQNAAGNNVSIDGLWALGFADGGIADFGAGPNNGPYNACYFTAGPQNGTHGLFGNLLPVQTEQTRDEE